MNKHICKAKRMNNNEWVYGLPCYNIYKQLCIQPVDDMSCCVIDPNTLCSCIAWQDSYKTLIFENDIVQFTCVVPEKFLVWWCKEMNMMTAIPLDGIGFNGYDYWNGKYPNYEYSSFCLMLQDPWGDFSEIKVIGNIIDNPELLKEALNETSI